jgi:hypothetical protein
MRRWKTTLTVAMVAAAIGVAGAAARTSTKHGPPAHLTAYGQLVWNFEGVAAQAAGSPFLCEQTSPNPTFNYTHKACSLPNADFRPWQPVFARHTTSSFMLSTDRPPDLGNVAPLQVMGRWIKCTSTTWLAMNGIGIWECTGA